MYNKAASLHDLSTDAGVCTGLGREERRCSLGNLKWGEKVYKIMPGWIDKILETTSVPLLSAERKWNNAKAGLYTELKIGQTPFFHHILFVQAEKTPLQPFERLDKKTLCPQPSWREPLYPEAAQYALLTNEHSNIKRPPCNTGCQTSNIQERSTSISLSCLRRRRSSHCVFCGCNCIIACFRARQRRLGNWQWCQLRTLKCLFR